MLVNGVNDQWDTSLAFVYLVQRNVCLTLIWTNTRQTTKFCRAGRGRNL